MRSCQLLCRCEAASCSAVTQCALHPAHCAQGGHASIHVAHVISSIGKLLRLAPVRGDDDGDGDGDAITLRHLPDGTAFRCDIARLMSPQGSRKIAPGNDRQKRCDEHHLVKPVRCAFAAFDEHAAELRGRIDEAMIKIPTIFNETHEQHQIQLSFAAHHFLLIKSCAKRR